MSKVLANVRHDARKRAPASITAALIPFASASVCPSPARLKSPDFDLLTFC
jgi:hypothetical protein